MASPELTAVIAALRENPYTAEKSVELLRQETEEGARARPLPEGYMREDVDAGGVPSEWVRMPESRPDRIFLMIHGGGYYRGLAAAVRGVSASIACAAACSVLSINYRRAPEHPFPAAVDDTSTTYRWLLSQSFSADHIVVGGISSGGGLTLALLLNCRDSGDPLPAGAVPMSAWTGPGPDRRELSIQRGRRSIDQQRVSGPVLSPVPERCGSAGASRPRRCTRTCKVCLHSCYRWVRWRPCSTTASPLPLAPRRRASTSHLEQWPEVTHGWQSRPHELPEAREAIEHVAEFYRRVVD